jgi:ABC-2 type transport system permease protein
MDCRPDGTYQVGWETRFMMYVIKQLQREWHFMLRQRYIIVLLACSLLISVFSIYSGLSEITQQHQTIERLQAADLTDRKEAQAKYDDPGSLAYYSFHLTYSPPSQLAFAALGERDIYPWKHRIRMLALEGQIYESDSQNAELAQAGKIDFVFVISALSPLLIILLFHDLYASERTSGRHDLLVTTAKYSSALWGARAVVRFAAILLCLMLPFIVGALLSDTPMSSIVLVSLSCLVYLSFWTMVSLWFGKKADSAPRVASGLIGLWVLLAFVLPILGDLAINQSVHSPKGGDIVLTQREAVNDAWDLPKATTMQAFTDTHPQYINHVSMQSEFEWKWYYAFQQVGDQTAASLSAEYRAAAARKYQLAGYVSLLSPPLLLQRYLTHMANTDALAAFEYEQQIRQFHYTLRMFYYPWLFSQDDFDKSTLESMPSFEQKKVDRSMDAAGIKTKTEELSGS